jgi:hypothetical protein
MLWFYAGEGKTFKAATEQKSVREDQLRHTHTPSARHHAVEHGQRQHQVLEARIRSAAPEKRAVGHWVTLVDA